MMEWILVAIGLAILLFAGDALVKGAVNLSLRLGVPALIVSLTIVAFGTSAPELLISVQSVLDGVPGLALGNVVGSNTANILLVLGIPALLATMHTSEHDTRSSFVQMLTATALFIGLCFFGVLTWISGLILLTGLALMLGWSFQQARKARNAEPAVEDLEGADPSMSKLWIGIWIVIGLIGLPVGAELLIRGATTIAQTFGLSESVIGLTLVAVGTSLPELATTVVAAIRRQADVALGNVIGSNMFNLLAIMGIATLFGPIPVDEQFLRVDLWVMAGASLLLVPFVLLKMNITRLWGVFLTLAYGVYVWSLL
ncbi:calcium/sodium antiporter [Loktanella sp. SALINAS62]|uniref:calcium/sodium antiporter n=1 Tax=Loktanella sp. SALINAS62 TaxID=2706124 RepID=UPI001B8AF0AC|nr:calcium/sodium antiporter [Loktanella sp. SALINAS62]MBS1302080.1 calcium/sodium antiporter [Loktanella sp. SALINAS62]